MEDHKAGPISDGIRAAIRASDRSVYSIAKQVECSPQQLYNFLAGKRGLSLAALDRLGVVLDLEVKHRSAARPSEVGTQGVETVPCEVHPDYAGGEASPAGAGDGGLVEPSTPPDAAPTPPKLTPSFGRWAAARDVSKGQGTPTGDWVRIFARLGGIFHHYFKPCRPTGSYDNERKGGPRIEKPSLPPSHGAHTHLVDKDPASD